MSNWTLKLDRKDVAIWIHKKKQCAIMLSKPVKGRWNVSAFPDINQNNTFRRKEDAMLHVRRLMVVMDTRELRC